MDRDTLDRLWQQALMQSVADGEQFTRYRFAALVAAHEREACAALCEEREAYSMPIPCPDGVPGCSVAHYVPGSREKTALECAAAIRSRT